MKLKTLLCAGVLLSVSFSSLADTNKKKVAERKKYVLAASAIATGVFLGVPALYFWFSCFPKSAPTKKTLPNVSKKKKKHPHKDPEKEKSVEGESKKVK